MDGPSAHSAGLAGENSSIYKEITVIARTATTLSKLKIHSMKKYADRPPSGPPAANRLP